MTNEVSITKLINMLFDERRDEHGQEYTNAYVAEQIGVAPRTVGRWRETDINVSLQDCRRLCAFFSVPLVYFDVESVTEAAAILVNHYESDHSLDGLIAAINMEEYGLPDTISTKTFLDNLHKLSPDNQQRLMRMAANLSADVLEMLQAQLGKD